MTAGSIERESTLSPNSPTEFVRAMTLTDATMLVAGSMIGSGIFIVSAQISRAVGSPLWLLLVWGLTGLITLLGALAYGELAAMYPRAGGQYVFLRESMGPLMGFLYGWTLFLIIQTGTIAAVAVAFGRFLGVLWPALTPDRYSWFPHADLCIRALGCTDPAGAIQLGLTPQRLARSRSSSSSASRSAATAPRSRRTSARRSRRGHRSRERSCSRSARRWWDRSSPATRGTT